QYKKKTSINFNKMTLAFSEYINSQPTCFPEKIWEGLISNNLSPGAFEYIEFEQAYQKKFEKSWDITATEPIIPKVHTIREDPSNRWRAGMNIHFVINNRTKNRFQFAPVVKCVSVQEIEITYAFGWPLVKIDKNSYSEA